MSKRWAYLPEVTAKDAYEHLFERYHAHCMLYSWYVHRRQHLITPRTLHGGSRVGAVR